MAVGLPLTRVSRLSPLQPYMGHESYYEWLREMLRGKRALLEEGVAAAGMTPMKGEGGILLMADTSQLVVPDKCPLEALEPSLGFPERLCALR